MAKASLRGRANVDATARVGPGKKEGGRSASKSYARSSGKTGSKGGGARAGSRGQLRIIGGQFRGRRLPVPSQPGLRPTSDRTRETLFNWLAPVIEGSRCLDCFAGAGALGFEAASRGAAWVSMIERANAVARQLDASAALLRADAVEVITADAERWLSEQPVQPYDIVFLDPPFALDVLASTCETLQRRGWVTAGSLIYLENDAGVGFPSLPAGWTLTRDKRAGQVRYGLAKVGRDGQEDDQGDDPTEPPLGR